MRSFHGNSSPIGCGIRRDALTLPDQPVSSHKESPVMAASAQQPIDLYYWPTPNGWKITIMLEECGLPYAIHPVNIGKGDQFKPEFLAISPNNKMPAIIDHDGPGGGPVSV